MVMWKNIDAGIYIVIIIGKSNIIVVYGFMVIIVK